MGQLSKTAHAAKQTRPNTVEAGGMTGMAACSGFMPPGVVIDACGVVTNVTRRRSRAWRGQRMVVKVPYGHCKPLTFTAALRCDGLTARMVLDGPMEGVAFQTHVDAFLIPTQRPDGDTAQSADFVCAHPG